MTQDALGKTVAIMDMRVERNERAFREYESILFAAVITRPDMAFVISRLSRFNTNPNESHQNRAIKMQRIRYYAIFITLGDPAFNMGALTL
jgi:hypothetical protein